MLASEYCELAALLDALDDTLDDFLDDTLDEEAGSCRLASWIDVIEGDGGGCTLLASVGAPEDSKER